LLSAVIAITLQHRVQLPQVRMGRFPLRSESSNASALRHSIGRNRHRSIFPTAKVLRWSGLGIIVISNSGTAP